MDNRLQLQTGESVLVRAPSAGDAVSQEMQLQAGQSVTIYAPTDQVEDTPPWEDIRSQLPVNTNPDTPWLVEQGRTGWWKRTLDQIDGITLHHTMSHDIHWMADYITRSKTNGGKGYPTTQYAFWIAADGTSSYCVDLTEAPWHDHCGDENTHVSVGLAGHWDKTAPPRVQLEGTVKVVAYLMNMLNIPMENVEGHREWSQRYTGVYKTVCPGWISGGWREQFFQMLQAEVNPASASFAVPAPDYAVMEAVLAEHDEGR